MNQKKHILVADDDPAIVESVQIILESDGYQVSKTVDVEEFIKTEKDLPDLILLDFWMIGNDGLDICRYLKTQEKTKNIPIIMISAHTDTAKIAKEAGAEGYITKPFELNHLLKKVKEYI